MDFQQGAFIDDFDLCIIVGNALDNALESCLSVRDEHRFIDVKGGPSAGCLLIQVANSSARPALLAGNLPSTTKTNQDNHGFGLRNIRRSLEKYQGTMDTHWEDGVFTSRC